MKKPRAYTTEEVRAKFLAHVWALIRSWQTVENPSSDRIEGFAFSMLAMLDGANGGLPGFKIIPDPHPEDKAYLKENGENWFPTKIDIGGDLHGMFHKAGKHNTQN